MTEEIEVTPKGKDFPEDYVKQLREEAATWRKKTRELEAQMQEGQIALEFSRRGIQAEPNWLKPMDGQTIPEAVEDFVAKYPQLVASAAQPPSNPNFRSAQSPLPPTENKPNIAGPPAQGALLGRDFESIKKDPIARKELTDHYRSLIAQNSHVSPNQG